MEKMPYQEHLDAEPVVPVVPAASAAPIAAEVGCADTDWRNGLPTLTGSLVTLRELRAADARSLFVAMTTDEVSRFISPPPATVEGFEKFIAWTHRQREAGQYACFAIVPRGSDAAIGLFQVRSLDADFGTAEWGFAIAAEFWGTGVFGDGARLTVSFAFATLRVHRLEARASLQNSRGNEALRKLGATREGFLRKSFLRHGEYHDQALWTILAEDWVEAFSARISSSIH
jgi:RimJ/RimL family protein N-acetyltransferase